MTARHVVDNFDPSDLLFRFHGEVVDVALDHRLGQVAPDVDIAVFRLQEPITPDLDLKVGGDANFFFSQDAYFLGFPYGLALTAGDIQYPFVKRGLISARITDSETGASLLYLDGMNNPGFSGGPVVFNELGTADWYAAGVVHGYRIDPVTILGGAEIVRANSGLVLAYGIQHALDAIDTDGLPSQP